MVYKMNELYKLCKVAKKLTFDYSGALQRDKADIIEWIIEISELYENYLVNPETFYSLVLDVQAVVNRIGYKLDYKLRDDELFIKIVEA